MTSLCFSSPVLQSPLPKRHETPVTAVPVTHACPKPITCSKDPAPRKTPRNRCSRCGQPGHNVRSCPQSLTSSSPWYPQRCSICGNPGHNARACPSQDSDTCSVCNGSQRLICVKCTGKGYYKSVEAAHGHLVVGGHHEVREGNNRMLVNPKQKMMAERARSRARFFIGGGGTDGRELVGGRRVGLVEEKSGELMCPRCLGRGYLSCMACSE